MNRIGRRICGGLRRIGAYWRRVWRPKKGSPMPTLLEDWNTHCVTIIKAAERILRADVTITDKGFADPNFIALALLIRTVSNLKGAMILLDARRIVEARTLARSCLENLYWTVGLYEEGDKFVKQMRDDELKYQKAAGQAIFASGATFEDDAVNGSANSCATWPRWPLARTRSNPRLFPPSERTSSAPICSTRSYLWTRRTRRLRHLAVTLFLTRAGPGLT